MNLINKILVQAGFSPARMLISAVIIQSGLHPKLLSVSVLACFLPEGWTIDRCVVRVSNAGTLRCATAPRKYSYCLLNINIWLQGSSANLQLLHKSFRKFNPLRIHIDIKGIMFDPSSRRFWFYCSHSLPPLPRLKMGNDRSANSSRTLASRQTSFPPAMECSSFLIFAIQ